MIWIIGSTIHYNNVKMNEATSRQKNEKSIVLPCSHTLGRLQVQLLFEGLGIMFVNSWCDRKRAGSRLGTRSSPDHAAVMTVIIVSRGLLY